MKYIFYCFILLFFICNYTNAENLQLTNFHRNYENYQNNDLIEELNFAENQIFQKNEKNEPFLTKLERLEMFLFGAIQSGDLGYRIGNVHRNSYYYHNPFNTRNFHPYSYEYHKPNYRYPRYRNVNHPYYEYIPQQILPKNYSLGTTVRIID